MNIRRSGATIESVAAKLGIGTAQTLLSWVRREQVDSGRRGGVTSDMAAEMRKLRAENKELKRANEILRSGFLRRGARPPVATLVGYVDDHKQVFGVEPICRVLSEHGMPIAPSTYYEARNRAPSRRAVRDEQLRDEVARVHQVNYGVYGARKVWLQLNRENIAIAHCTVRRLMAEQGLAGAHRGKMKRTTIADPQALRAQDLVNRKFDPAAPNALWVADFT